MSVVVEAGGGGRGGGHRSTGDRERVTGLDTEHQGAGT